MDKLREALLEKSIDHLTRKFKPDFNDCMGELALEIGTDDELRKTTAGQTTYNIVIGAMINLLTNELGSVLADSRAAGREIDLMWINSRLLDAMIRYDEEREDEDDDDDEDDRDLKADRDYWLTAFYDVQQKLIALQSEMIEQ